VWYDLHMNTVDVLGKLHDSISQPVLFAIFGILCIIFGISSFVLIFHWNRYAIDKSMIITAQAVYFLGGALIILVGFLSVVLY
jgi:hypothetical protein